MSNKPSGSTREVELDTVGTEPCISTEPSKTGSKDVSVGSGLGGSAIAGGGVASWGFASKARMMSRGSRGGTSWGVKAGRVGGKGEQ